MVLVLPAPALLDTTVVSLYYAKDPLLANLPVVIFHGPSMTTTNNSSRIQAHVYSIAGFQSFPRLTISPTSPLYAAVHYLPDEKQGDETCRGLAVSLLKYYAEMPKVVKSSLKEMAAIGRPDSRAPAMFDEKHAADLVANMVRIDHSEDVADFIASALTEKCLSWTDLDVILPENSISKVQHTDDPVYASSSSDDGVNYGKYESLVKMFGSPTFLPTSKLRRAPSKPTAVSKTRLLADDQKDRLLREMREILNTEKSYVGKIYDLVHSVAIEFCRKADSRPYQSTVPSERAMQKLFPESLSKILEVNTAFLNCIRELLGNNDEMSLDEISMREKEIRDPTNESRARDCSAIDSFAKALLDWFPQFQEPYQDYLRASTEFPRILNDFLRDSASHFSQQIHVTGEQRLKSWLIEPVQRLPRYSLFIDNIVNQLPATHPAMSKFLRAKDIITDICALDNDQSKDQNLTNNRLKDLVSGWPATLAPTGRLIAAVDVAELKAPYKVTATGREGQASILLLFPDNLVVVRKVTSTSLSARGLLAEVDRPAVQLNAASQTGDFGPPAKGLTFAFAFHLQETRFTESNDGRLISMACVRRSDFVNTGPLVTSRQYYAVTRVFSLMGSYEGKAARWNEEVARARIEERFPEKMRESDTWTLRSISPEQDSIGILAAVFENDDVAEVGQYRTSHGRVKVIVDQDGEDRRSSGAIRRDRDVEITARLTRLQSGHYYLQFAGFSEYTSTDNVSIKDLIAVFLKRLANLQRLHHQPHTLEASEAYISYHQKVVESLPLRAQVEDNQTRRFRPISPVKALSNFLGSNKDLMSPMKNIPTMPPPGQLPVRSRSNTGMVDQASASKVTLINAASSEPDDSIVQLELTFTTYVVALRQRCGNVVGKVIRGRAGADELIVNELYNTLIEDPSKIQLAAEVPVDVLFAAFEKFLNKAWRKRLGPVLAALLLRRMESAFDSSSMGQATENFKVVLGEMTPQNRRAFTAMIKLLSDLLEASGNDGDRGALIATFAEALVVEGNPHSYVTLLDRLVEDFDTLFEDLGPSPEVASDALTRARSINTGSLSSNASSIRKRFGFGGLSRENSKTDESRVVHVWRTLSKKSPGDNDSKPPSLSKSFLSRSRSTDNDSRKALPSRPVSQDRPSSSSSTQEENKSRPGSAHNMLSNLITIGEGGAEKFHTAPRKKRRSSLSDLQTMQNSGAKSFGSPRQLTSFGSPRQLTNVASEDSIKPFQTARQNLRTPSPTKSRIPSSLNASPRSAGSPSYRGNSPSARKILTERAVNSKPEEVIPSGFSPEKRGTSQTGILPLKPTLQEQIKPFNISSPSPKNPTTTITKPPQKLRMQSPQKLRERLQSEKFAIQATEPGLQLELAKIGEELSTLSLSHSTYKSSSSRVVDLTARLTTLETKLATTLRNLTARTAAIQTDVETSLLVSEKKARGLDELYREANAENEALYERFNEELGKVLKGVKGGDGVEEMRGRLRQVEGEAGRLRRENMRLRRENAGLRCQLKGE